MYITSITYLDKYNHLFMYFIIFFVYNSIPGIRPSLYDFAIVHVYTAAWNINTKEIGWYSWFEMYALYLDKFQNFCNFESVNGNGV